MNYKKILIGGLVAGLIINVLQFLVYYFVTSKKIASLQSNGYILSTPRLPFEILWVLGMFVMGILLAYFYALARPRLGPGPITAIKVNLLLALMIHVPYNVMRASYGLPGRFLPLVDMVAGIIIFLVAGYIAAWIYQEKES